LVDLSAAQSATKGSVVEGTNAKQLHAWPRFQRYLTSIGLHSDPYLDSSSQFQRSKILSAFAHALREGRFGNGKNGKTIKSDSVRSTLDCISQAFKLADRPDPRLDRDGKFTLFKHRQLRGYNSLDPPTNPQPAMTASLLRQFYTTSLSTFDRTLCELFIGAVFSAMRSCKCIQVSGPRRTKLEKHFFFRNCRCLPHSDSNLHKADCVSITFKLQKQDSKHDIITQHCSSDLLLCTVKVWAKK